MSEFSVDIPAQGAALLERDRRVKTGLFLAGTVLALGLARRFYKPLLAGAVALYIGTRPPVKQFLSRAAALLRRETQ